MTEKIIKVDTNNVAVVSEARAIHSKDVLEAQKVQFQARIAKIDELLAVFA